ncbi:hypothetical protein NDU88_010968 [Pleurodeles waltl]|uniref:Reverse transcriptase/retrotransposon-derived protein RNase H-like domain-containing protein n=1 Tax=Pleurodeles waltl TaxID=8319 RepID=A0AAV7S3E3_PLEWA|nr:hypothetical protein NDU88_010968 [Pleurodeles waltl]
MAEDIVAEDTILGVLAGLQGVINIRNEILVHAPTNESHLERQESNFQMTTNDKNQLHVEWGPDQEVAFQATMMALYEDTMLVYFIPNKESELAVHASPTGLEAVLSQKQMMGLGPL